MRNLYLLIISILIFGACRRTQKDLSLQENKLIDSLSSELIKLTNVKDSLVIIENEIYAQIRSRIPSTPKGYSINLDSYIYGSGHVMFGENKFKIEMSKYLSLLKYNKADHFINIYGTYQMKGDSVLLQAKLATGHNFLKTSNGSCSNTFNEYVDTLIQINWAEIAMNSMRRKDKGLSEKMPQIIYDDIKESQLINKDSLNGEYKYLSLRKATKEDIEDCSLEELKIMRNEIFARLGYQFKDSFLNNYYSNKDWYKREYRECNVMEFLNEIEKYNIDFIKRHEDEKSL